MAQRDDEESEVEQVIEPLPPHRVRFTDMPWPLVDKAIRSKLNQAGLTCVEINPFYLTLFSMRESHSVN